VGQALENPILIYIGALGDGKADALRVSPAATLSLRRDLIFLNDEYDISAGSVRMMAKTSLDSWYLSRALICEKPDHRDAETCDSAYRYFGHPKVWDRSGQAGIPLSSRRRRRDDDDDARTGLVEGEGKNHSLTGWSWTTGTRTMRRG